MTGACIESELLWAGPPPFERSPSCGLVLPYWWLAGGLGEREKEIEAGVTVNGDNGCLGVRDGEDLTQALSADGVTVVLTYRLRLSWFAHFVLFVEQIPLENLQQGEPPW